MSGASSEYIIVFRSRVSKNSDTYKLMQCKTEGLYNDTEKKLIVNSRDVE